MKDVYMLVLINNYNFMTRLYRIKYKLIVKWKKQTQQEEREKIKWKNKKKK